MSVAEKCKVDECDRVLYGYKQYCKMHYQRWAKWGDPYYIKRPKVSEYKTCQIDGCERPHRSRGLCSKHYDRWSRRRGDISTTLVTEMGTYASCKIDGCKSKGNVSSITGKETFTRGYCDIHYRRFLKYRDPNKTELVRHGKHKSTEYIIWASMKQRCYNKNHRSYKDYGGRGIKMCDRWLGKYGFLNFLSDVGKRPSPKLSIDRIDNNGNYEPSNVKWSTATEQASNRRPRCNN